MGLTGKYDFPGIKKQGANGLLALLSTIPWLAPILKFPVIGTLFKGVLELLVNWFANNGLVLLNIGAIYVEGKIDQQALDKALDDGIKRVEQANGTLTPEEGNAIDQKVMDAADKALPYNKPTKHN